MPPWQHDTSRIPHSHRSSTSHAASIAIDASSRMPTMQSFQKPRWGAPKSSLMFTAGSHAGRAYASNVSDIHLLWEAAGPSQRNKGLPPPKQRQLADWRKSKEDQQERDAIGQRLAARLENKERAAGAAEPLLLTDASSGARSSASSAGGAGAPQPQHAQRVALGARGASEGSSSPAPSRRGGGGSPSKFEKQLPQPELRSARPMPGTPVGMPPPDSAGGAAGSSTALALVDGGNPLTESEERDRNLAIVATSALESALEAFGAFRQTHKKWFGAAKEVNALPPPRKCGFTPSSLATQQEIEMREAHDALHMHRGGDKALANSAEGRQTERAMHVAPSRSIQPKERKSRSSARDAFRQKSARQITMVQQQQQTQQHAQQAQGQDYPQESKERQQQQEEEAPQQGAGAASSRLTGACRGGAGLSPPPSGVAPAATPPASGAAAASTARATPGPHALVSVRAADGGALTGGSTTRREKVMKSASESGFVKTLTPHEAAHKRAVRKALEDAASKLADKQEAAGVAVTDRKAFSERLIRDEAARAASARRPADGASASPLRLHGIKVRQVGRELGSTRHDVPMAPGWQEQQVDRKMGYSSGGASTRLHRPSDAFEVVLAEEMEGEEASWEALEHGGEDAMSGAVVPANGDDESPPPRPWVRTVDAFGRDSLWAKPWGRLYSAPPYRTDEKECRTRVNIDYGNGFIALERPEWTAAQLPEPWVDPNSAKEQRLREYRGEPRQAWR
jgi:hypothetical protein